MICTAKKGFGLGRPNPGSDGFETSFLLYNNNFCSESACLINLLNTGLKAEIIALVNLYLTTSGFIRVFLL